VDKKEAFITAIKNNEGLIHKVASIYTNTMEDKNDLIQEIIYQLWKSFDTFNQHSALSTWMYRVAMNVAIYHLNKDKRQISTVPMDGQVVNFHEADNSGMEEKWQVFRQHVNQLNLLDKGIVLLYVENKTYEEIAEITGISISNVGTKLSRIKEKIKRQISKQR
jgi:RNA polymerase sigma-70 factor (ECF subfamily)